MLEGNLMDALTVLEDLGRVEMLYTVFLKFFSFAYSVKDMEDGIAVQRRQFYFRVIRTIFDE